MAQPEFNHISNMQRLFKQKSLLDILLEIENVLDYMNLYIYPHWQDGEVVQGPDVSKYWAVIMLRYDWHAMPDPMGARVLHDIGIKVNYRKGHEQHAVPVKSPADYQPGTKKPRMVKRPVWYVELKIPRRYLDDQEFNELEDMNQDDEFDVEAIKSAATETDDSGDLDVQDQQGSEPSPLGDTPT